MLNQEAIEEVAPKLVKENFYRIAHQRIYESMMDLYVRHIPIDHISLADNLRPWVSWRPWAAKRTSSSWQTTRSPSPTGRTTWKSSSAPPSCATHPRVGRDRGAGL